MFEINYLTDRAKIYKLKYTDQVLEMSLNIDFGFSMKPL